MPAWVVAGLLNCLFLFLYVMAFLHYGARPSLMVSLATHSAILLSLFLAVALVVREILNAENGEVAHAVSSGLVNGLNLSWATTSIAFVTFIGFVPASQFLTDNLQMAFVGAGALLVVLIGYYVAKPSKPAQQVQNVEGMSRTQALAVTQEIHQTNPQRPAFQATIADLTRLLSHQAGRAIGYAGSNVLFDDTFSLELDVNARVARVYSNTSLINTSDFIHWRLHMLLMGPAAEKVLTGQSSEVAIDDFTSFDDLASRYLTLRSDRTFNAKPMNQHEAALKASRISLLRKTIFDRCLAACTDNRKVLVELVKLMRTRSVLTYGDIRSHLERVQMAEGFPVADFNETEILQKALLTYDEHEEITLEDAFTQSEPSGDDAAIEEKGASRQDCEAEDRSANQPHFTGGARSILA